MRQPAGRLGQFRQGGPACSAQKVKDDGYLGWRSGVSHDHWCRWLTTVGTNLCHIAVLGCNAGMIALDTCVGSRQELNFERTALSGRG